MANADIVAFNIAAFISTLFLLEFGADKFIDHTAIVARRINVSQAVIGLLTAGAEWEEVGWPSLPIFRAYLLDLKLTFTACSSDSIPRTRSFLSRRRKRSWLRHFKHSWRIFPWALDP